MTLAPPKPMAIRLLIGRVREMVDMGHAKIPVKAENLTKLADYAEDGIRLRDLMLIHAKGDPFELSIMEQTIDGLEPTIELIRLAIDAVKLHRTESLYKSGKLE